MNQSPTLSIIVPVYNAESYIDQCIQSVLDQSFRDLELILVNDGSTDASLQKCLSWEKDPRVRVISGENHGVSHARNLGLASACGEWILFLDSDDHLLDGALPQLMQLAAPDTQQVLAAYTTDQPEAVTHLSETVSAADLLKMSLDSVNHRLLPAFYPLKPLSLAACWAKLYRGRVIRENGLRFHEGLRLSEDTLFNLDYLSCIETVTVSNLPVLYYRQNTGSVTHVFHAHHLTNRFRFFDILTDRYGQDAAVHILSLLFFEICKIERCARGRERKQLEKLVSGYLSNHMELLCSSKTLSLSSGRWQRLAYSLAALCFRHRLYWAGFGSLRLYTAATTAND